MPSPSQLATGGFVRWNAHSAGAVLGIVALGWGAAALVAVQSFLSAAVPSSLLVPAALVLLACAVFHAHLLWSSMRQRSTRHVHEVVTHFAFWRRLTLGVALAYLLALVLGPRLSTVCVWLATIAIWQTCLFLPLAATPTIAESWRRWTQGHAPRRLSWLVYVATAVLFAGEGMLRVHRLLTDGMLLPTATASTIELTGAAVQGEPVALPLDRLKSGRFRVALAGDAQKNCDGGLATRVQQMLPGAEIVDLNVDLDHSDLRVGDVATAVEATGADLVLVVLPVCEDLSRSRENPSAFDWRRLELASLISDDTPEKQAVQRAVSAKDFEAYLGEVGPHLAACRTPLSDVMRSRWERTYATLDRAIVGCRQAEVPLALVVVPGEFQLNDGLRNTLLRRHGVSPEQFDAELPQRRLAGFAQQRGLPLVDLLPHLRLCDEAVYHRHTTTLNDRGNQAAATAIGGWLASRYGDRLAAQLSKAP